MSFRETQCANPFKIEKDVNNTQKNIAKYLSDSSLYIYEMKYEYYEVWASCAACFCSRQKGYTHYIKIDSTDRKKAENLCFGK
ncbi:MAG TPA: hypothetical protein VEC12_05275 [Bacteroidia bacterium]|nr:hypothetical protein [Bacteroidia bacterium]